MDSALEVGKHAFYCFILFSFIFIIIYLFLFRLKKKSVFFNFSFFSFFYSSLSSSLFISFFLTLLFFYLYFFFLTPFFWCIHHRGSKRNKKRQQNIQSTNHLPSDLHPAINKAAGERSQLVTRLDQLACAEDNTFVLCIIYIQMTDREPCGNIVGINSCGNQFLLEIVNTFRLIVNMASQS